MKNKISLVVGLILLGQFTFAQDLSREFKNWFIYGANLRVSKKTTVKVNRLNSFDVKGYKMGFNQTTLGIAQRVSKKWEYGGAYALSGIAGREEKLIYHRLSLYASHRSYFGKLQMKNTAQLEKYFPVQPKFGARLVLTNRLRYSNKRWKVNLSPYIKNQFYYYQGGTPIIYWLEEADIEPAADGEEVEESLEQSPNGWHRYRFTFGLRYKMSKRLAASLFYTKQIEFNTGLAPYRELNVYNKSKTRIKRPFNNYALVGLSLVFTLKTY